MNDRKIHTYCTNNDCKALKQGEKSHHEILGMRKPEGMTAPQMVIKCEICGNERLHDVPRITKQKRYFPYYHPGYDVKFESQDHEKKWLKSQGGEYI